MTLVTLYIEFDGTGVLRVPHELAGGKGKQQDGSAKNREVKPGCVFTQTAFDEDGRPVRDPVSTTFTGAIEAACKNLSESASNLPPWSGPYPGQTQSPPQDASLKQTASMTSGKTAPHDPPQV